MPPSPFASLLSSGPVVLDGAWGTQLQARGLPPGGCPDLWNLERPQLVEEVAAAYVAAGSRVILSNTFGANRVVLERHGLADRVAEINRAGAAISRRAAGGRALVIASVGPTGRLPSAGEITGAEAEAAFAEQMAALGAGGADGVVVETLADAEEAAAAARAARALGLPVVLSFTFDAGKDLDRTMTGLTPEKAALLAQREGAAAVGLNCGLGGERAVPLVRRLAAAGGLPVWAKPNAGVPELVDGRSVWRGMPADFAAHGPALVAAGARLVGGCCGSSPAHLAALAAALPRRMAAHG